MSKKLKKITLGELKTRLSWVLDLPDETEITFGAGDLSLDQPKPALYNEQNEPVVVQLRFNELYSVTLDLDAK